MTLVTKTPADSQKVVITGIGVIGPFGAGLDALGVGLAEGESVIAPAGEVSALLDPVEGSDRLPLDPRVGWAAKVPADAIDEWLSRRESRRMSHPSKLAVAAARMALADRDDLTASDDRPPIETSGLAVFLATVYGASSITESLLEDILLRGPEAASPFDFAESVANAPAAQAARLLGARGPNVTLCQREAGVLTSIHRARREILSGRSPAVLAGAVDEVTATLLAILQRFGSLAASESGDGSTPPRPKPLDRRRSGFIVGEGSTIVVVESSNSAAPNSVLAEVVATASVFDPTAEASFWGEGSELLGRALVRCLDSAGLKPTDVDLIVSGASGAVKGDRIEAQTLRAAWGQDPLPPVLTPKAVVGELGGVQLAAAVLALQGAEFAAVAGFEETDPALGIEPWPGGAFPQRPKTVLITALGAGGATSFAVLRSAQPTEADDS